YILILQVLQDGLDLIARCEREFILTLRAQFRVPAQQRLADHDQWCQQQLDDVGDKQPEHKRHWWVELQWLGARKFQPSHSIVQTRMMKKKPIEPTRSVTKRASRSSRLNLFSYSAFTSWTGLRWSRSCANACGS